MEITVKTLLESIRTRKSVSAAGISVASAFISSLGDCLTGAGDCPVNIFKLASGEIWQKELAEAAGRLTYCRPRITADGRPDESDCLSKSYREGTDILKGAVLEYDAVWSTKARDRDGDIMEQKGGLDVDLRMPLLWQHIQVQPIGKHVALLEQDEFQTKSRFAIADTELGRDAAVLVKFGALRKSHGFRPKEFSPVELVKDANGQNKANGWHIRKAATMEASLVSIPANPETSVLAYYEKEFDGVCTAFSRGDLKSAGMKRWAKSIYDARPVQVSGATLSTKEGSAMCATKAAAGTMTVKEPLPADSSGMDPTKIEKCPKCSAPMNAGGKCTKCDYIKDGPAKSAGGGDAPLATKGVADLTTKAYGDNPYLDGSYEAIRWNLDSAATRFLMAKNIITDEYDRGYCHIVATFGDSAVICHRKDGKSNCYRISYGMADGVAAFTGEPAAVEIKTSIVEKMIEDFATKAGKKTATQIAAELVSIAMTSASPSTQKALDDVAGAAQLLRQQREYEDMNQLLMIDG